MDAKEKKEKRERERYAKMTNEKKQEMLKRLREAYHEKQKNKESLKGPAPGSTITRQARLIVGNIIHHEDGRIDSCQDVHAADGTEKLGNIIGKLN
jgi:predicted Fe-S protein YdhL (DUF1289 family)